jgi:hypothetical protein
MIYVMTYWDITYGLKRKISFFRMDVALKVMEFRLQRPHLYAELTLNTVKEH